MVPVIAGRTPGQMKNKRGERKQKRRAQTKEEGARRPPLLFLYFLEIPFLEVPELSGFPLPDFAFQKERFAGRSSIPGSLKRTVRGSVEVLPFAFLIPAAFPPSHCAFSAFLAFAVREIWDLFL
jgi:hypothetical protein